MKARHRIVAAGILAASAALLRADDKPLPVSEDQIVREVEGLIDRSARISEKDGERVRELIAKGIKAHEAKDYEKAVSFYRKVLEIDPVSDSAYYEMGFSYSEMGDQTRALDAVIRSLTINPKAEAAYVLKGSILDDLGHPELAKKAYKSLLEIQPKSYLAHLNLGISQARLGELDEAEASFKKAAESEPDRGSPWVHLGSLAAQRGYDYDARRYLEKFLKLAPADPRAPAARKTLAELDNAKITIDPTSPYASIDMIVAIARVTWKKKHREAHPEAHGYALTFEEERAIDEELILPQWREEKKKNPAAAQPAYDLLLRVSDAGFLPEYIYYTRRQAIGADATRWLEEHAPRVQAFEGWARKEGLMREPAAPTASASAAAAPASGDTAEAGGGTGGGGGTPAASHSDSPDAVAETLKALETSSRNYVMSAGDSADSERFRKDEKERFAKAVKFSGTNKADCPRSVAELRNLARADSGAFHTALRCSSPGDSVYAEVLKSISIRGQRVRELDVRVSGGVFVKDATIQIRTVNMSWLSYLTAKAAWRMETALRVKWRGEPDYRPSVGEELFAWGSAAIGYERMREGAKAAKKEDKDFQADPVLDRVVGIAKSGDLRGFVLYEVLHKTYGLSLESLEDSDAAALDAYLGRWVLVSTGASD